MITRSLAIIPAAVVIAINTGGGVDAENHAIYNLLLLSQVVLSVQLTFATVPLVLFTSKKSVMGDFASRLWMKVLAWAVVAAIAGLNAYLIYQQFA
jgi:manganese transport protein